MRLSVAPRALSTILPLLILFSPDVARASRPEPGHDQGTLLRQHAVRQPITFFPASGASGAVAYESHLAGYDLQVRPSGMTIRSERVLPPKHASKPAFDGGLNTPQPSTEVVHHQTTVEFLGANPSAQLEPLDPSRAHVNRFVGHDPALWQHDLPTFSRVRAQQLYPGVDLVYYGGGQGSLEYDLVVAPHADLNQIRFRAQGDAKPVLEADGSLDLDGKDGGARLNRPVLYQDRNGTRSAILGSFVQVAPGEFGFHTAAYDHDLPLIIDPTIKLVYATYAGGIHNELEFGMALDPSGNAYIVGESASQDFPITGNALQTTRTAIGTYTYDAVILKFDASGDLLYSTFLGGSGNDTGFSVVVAPDGSAYVGGVTNSSDFPVTSGAFQKTLGGGTDAFLAKISNDGSQLLYSTFLGGPADESIQALILNADGSLWIGGDASGSGLPVSANAAQKTAPGADDAFVAKAQFDDTGALSLPYLSFLGGSGNGEELGTEVMTTDSAGNLYIAGGTTSADFPVTANAYEKPFKTSGGCFNTQLPNTIGTITKFSPDLSQILYSSVIGGHTEDQNGYPVCNQFVRTVHVDAAGNIWLIGTTGMSDFPTTTNAMSKMLNGTGGAGVDDFVAELSADGTKLLYGSYFGGSQFDYGANAQWDSAGHIWLANTTQSPDYPVTSDALQKTNAGGYDTGITELSADGTTVLYSTYLGGSGDDDINGSVQIRLDAQGNIRLTGVTDSANYPVTSTAVQQVYANGNPNPDGFDLYYSVLGTGLIGTVGPVSGGNSGDTTITVSGAGYADGATCSLVQGSTTIASTTAVVNASGTSISCTFALNGAVAGSYDVVVKNPDGSSYTKPGSFTVQSGGQPNLSVSLVGRPIVRTGYPSTFHINVTNSGNENAYFTPLWVSLPKGLTFAINGYTTAQSAMFATTVGSTSYVNLLLPIVAPGQTLSIPLQIQSSADAPSIPLSATLQAPWFSSSAAAIAAADSTTYDAGCVTDAINPYASNCMGPYITTAVAGGIFFAPSERLDLANPLVLSGTPKDNGGGPTACFKPNSAQKGEEQGKKDAEAHLPLNYGQNPYGQNPLNPDSRAWNFGYGAGYLAGQLLNIVNSIPPVPSFLPIAPGSAAEFEASATRPQAAGDSCMNPPPPPPNMKPSGTAGPASGGSIDPNYKSGSSGDGSKSAFVRAGAALTYAVGFENEAKALLPAAQVVVTDQLDPTKVDLTTLTLSTITIGNNVITLPAGTSNYSTLYKLSANLSVRIQGSLDVNSGLLKWTFTSIDPNTGLPPTDPTVGFLPPDTDGIVGQGNVQFAVVPKAGQTTGTAINNMAKVVFDTNAPIVTPVFLNTLDADPPASTVSPLPALEVPGGTATTATFPVTWSGTDKGSGVKTYTVYVSDNEGQFTALLTDTTATTVNFTGTTGHTYGFYIIATDGAGNVEAAKTKPDTTTTVSSLAPTTTTLSLSGTTAVAGSSLTISATVSPASGTGTPTGMITFMDSVSGSLGSATLAAGKASVSTTKLGVGMHSITAVYAGDSVFAPSTSSAMSVTITAVPPDYTVSLSSSSATVKGSGGTVNTTISLDPTGGFAGSIALSCSGLPARSTCTFNPASLTASGSTAAKSVMTITTNVSTTASLFQRNSSEVAFALVGGGLLGFSLLRRRRLASLLAVLCLSCAFWGLVGCGGSSPSPSTPAGTYTVTITATSGTTSHNATLNLTVQ